MSEQKYTIELVQPNDTSEVLKLLQRTFYIDEPLNEASQLCATENDQCPDLDGYCEHSLHDGLSVKAVDEHGNIVGVLINGERPVKSDEEEVLNLAEKCHEPKLQKILYVVAKRERGAKLWEKFPEENNIVEVKIAAVDKAWRRRGLMNAMMTETEKLTRQRDIHLLRIDTSSAYSAKSAERLGFTCMYEAKYTDIKMDGRPLVVPKSPHLYDRVYTKKIE